MKSKPLLILAGAAGAAAYALFRKRAIAQKASQSLSPVLTAIRNVDRTIAIPTAMTVGSIAVWSRMSHGNTLRYTFVPTMALSWALYMLYLRKNMPDPGKITSFYLFALAWQLVHFVEENSTGFRYRWPVEIFGTKPNRMDIDSTWPSTRCPMPSSSREGLHYSGAVPSSPSPQSSSR